MNVRSIVKDSDCIEAITPVHAHIILELTTQHVY